MKVKEREGFEEYNETFDTIYGTESYWNIPQCKVRYQAEIEFYENFAQRIEDAELKKKIMALIKWLKRQLFMFKDKNYYEERLNQDYWDEKEQKQKEKEQKQKATKEQKQELEVNEGAIQRSTGRDALEPYELMYQSRKDLEIPLYDGKSQQEYVLERMYYDNPAYSYVVMNHLSETVKPFKRPVKSLSTYTSYYEEEELYGNLHFLPNTFIFNKKKGDGSRDTTKSKRNVHHINAFYVDIDYYNKGIDLVEALLKVDEIIKENQLPTPSLTINSGGGIYLFWKITSIPCNHSSILWHFDNIQTVLYHMFKEVGADANSKDVTHMFKLAGTHNLKYAEQPEVTLLNVDYTPLEMWDFTELLKDKYPKVDRKKAKTYDSSQLKGKKPIKKGNNLQTLFNALKEDFLTIDKTLSLQGNRKFVTFVLVNYMKNLRYTPQQTEKELREWNNRLQIPQSEGELFDYNIEDATWRFTTKLIVEKLQIEKELQQQLKVLKILSPEEKRQADKERKATLYQEDKEYKKTKLFKKRMQYLKKVDVRERHAKKALRDNVVKALRELGKTQKEIIQELNQTYDITLSIRTLNRIK